jgi:hypothetical protein
LSNRDTTLIDEKALETRSGAFHGLLRQRAWKLLKDLNLPPTEDRIKVVLGVMETVDRAS